MNFVFSFVNCYLPLVNVIDNNVKKGFFPIVSKKLNFMLYRLNYFSFPVISELYLICSDSEILYNFVNSYRFQLDIYIKILFLSKDLGEFLLRFYRVPLLFSFKNKLTT